MENSNQSDASQISRTLMVHETVSETPEFQEYLRQEATRDLHINMEAKILALQEVAAKNFAPHTSITHPRLLVLQMQDDHAPLQNRGSPSTPNSDAKGKIGPT
ncbi:hypothetical protein PGT21_004065 [Puccinia graminis f. sp. tritici]|uniref:Uncharacterized protein n=1 Tax=Puccinia graminis f. sp. tritici TaxID=56615 RepID=A0A5B0QVN6_PUCGR|nr:hypothetical protein PGTUg99_004489 [Puccinia graminis f. sp. tritici]KAA1117336.1 hypothetical protein PGT21_004065 [Puccinia graminis f. sp. tritici]